MRPQKRVLMSINEPTITKVITLTLKKEFADTYDLSIAEIPSVAKLLVQAQREGVDLFILLLNNMHTSEVQFLDGKKNWFEARLEVITHLRQTYRRPVIAMTGWYPGDASRTEEIIKEAGASFFLPIPVEGGTLTKAVNQCLEEGAPA